MVLKLFTPSTSFVAALVGAFAVMIWRVREGRRPVTMRTILVPPLGMATGFSMFLVPAVRVPGPWAATAFLVGALVLALPLIRSSRLVLEQNRVVVRRSKAFFAVLFGLALVRLLARQYFGRFISLEQTAGLFFVLAFGMVLAWRASMFVEYRKLVATR